VRYASGRVVAAMSAAYSGEGKTDAKDAYVIAETARIRRDLTVIDHRTDLMRNLSLLIGHRADLVVDRVRMINRLRDVTTSVFPSLEGEFDYSSCKGALIVLTAVTPAQNSCDVSAKHASPRGYGGDGCATTPRSQLGLPGQDIAAAIIAELATNTLTLDQRLTDLDGQIAATFDQHPQAAIIASMPGFGPILGATLLVAAGELTAFPSAGHLAAAAGLVPVPNDSGRRTGNRHKPRRYSRPLRHVFYLSAQTSMMRDGPNRDYYLKKRAHGRTHTQAVIALARRRIDVLWAMLHTRQAYQPGHTRAA
jgi:transposase